MSYKAKFSILELRHVFKKEDSRFLVATGLKVSGISLIITLFVNFFLFEVLRLNYAFFTAHGFQVFGDSSAFYDTIIQESFANFAAICVFHVALFFIGVYVGWLMLRPFRTMGDYCEKVIEEPNTIYYIEEFSTYKLFIRFSEFFFEYLRDSRKNGQLTVHSIPPQYSRIHKPIVDKVFMLHFGLLLVIVSISSAIFIIETTSDTFSGMVELATKTLTDYKKVNSFFSEQAFILNDIVWLTITIVTICYVLLGFHLYSKVAGAAFGIFSTMRSFMKGNYFSRVHLVGYAYLRESTRKLNKYLDHVQNNYVKDKG